jgi:hypothetical protein
MLIIPCGEARFQFLLGARLAAYTLIAVLLTAGISKDYSAFIFKDKELLDCRTRLFLKLKTEDLSKCRNVIRDKPDVLDL